MIEASIIIFLFILYTLACIADGQDVKPLWKRWLGRKLEKMADSLHPIDYCIPSVCKHRLRSRIPDIHPTTFDSARIEKNVMISEYQLAQAAIRANFGEPFPEYEYTKLIEDGKRVCIREIEKVIEEYNLVNIVIDSDSDRPNIIIRGWLIVGRKREGTF